MAPLEFTEDEFVAVLQKAHAYYATIVRVFCPYLRGDVQFNSQGMEHLRRKSWNRGRPRHDQFMRLKHLAIAPAILRLSATVQGVWHGHERNRRRRHGRWEEHFKPATFYEFVAVMEDRRFKVIVKQTSDGEIVFWSLIPFWRQKGQGSRVLHDGNLGED